MKYRFSQIRDTIVISTPHPPQNRVNNQHGVGAVGEMRTGIVDDGRLVQLEELLLAEKVAM